MSKRDLCPVGKHRDYSRRGSDFPTPEVETIVTARVVHVNDNIEGAVYIGRANGRKGLPASKWANPMQIKNYRQVSARSYVIELYRVGLMTGDRAKLASLPELRGKPLACWCRHDGEPRTDANACHGDVLVELLERYTDDELRAMAGGTS